MARSSRHKSHRSHKHRDRSDSEDEGSSRDRKQKVEEEESARVSRVSDQEKRKSSSKDGIGTSNGDMSGDHGKKRKDRGEDSNIDGDRWNGGGDDDTRVEKESKKEGSEAADLEKSSKSKSSGVDLKGKSSSSSRRREGSSEKNEEKRKEEKETSRRESSSSQHKDEKEKERERERERERGPEKEKKVQDSRHERSEDGGSRREEHAVKQGVEISELQDEMHNPETEKELDKRIKRRRDGSGDHDRIEDGREGDDRQISSRDGHSKNGSYKDGRNKEKYREEVERVQLHHVDKHTDERFSRTHTNERSDSKHYRDEIRYSDTRDKKTKLQDSRRVDDHSTKLKDNRGRKRSLDEIEDHNDLKPRSAKEPRDDTSKNGSSSSKFDSRSDRARTEHQHIDKVDSSMSNSRTKNSPNASTYAGKDSNRLSSRQAESMHRDSVSEDTRQSGGVSRDHATAAGSRERITESQSSVKARLGDGTRSNVYMKDAGSISHLDRISRSDARASPNQLTEKSPSTSERRSERTSARRCLDVEEGGQRSSSSKGGRGDTSFTKDNGRDQDYLKEKPNEDDTSQLDLLQREHVSVGPSSNKSSQLQSSSPGHFPPPALVRLGVDSPSVLGTYEDEARIQNGERKINTRYKRSGDASGGRGPGTPWKSAPTWPSPVANGFMPHQHGPPAGFHPAVAQFPAPPLFGIRPSMDLNNTSYHIHEAGNRFPGHARPYGWHNPVDDCSHLQVWDGNTNVFGDESHVYGRQEWDQNRHLMSSRGWELSSDMWSGQNGNANMEFPGPQKEHGYSRQTLSDEAWVGQTADSSRDEQARSEQGTADASVIKLSSDASPVKQVIGASSKSVSEEMPEHSKISSVKGTSEKQSDNNVRYCCTYLSKLDISHDLIQPELYKQYMSLMEARDRNVTSNTSSEGQWKNNVDGLRLVAKSKQCARNSLFPTAKDATFQRAMSLYRKQKGGMKEVMHCALSQVCSEENKRPESTDGEKVTANHMEEGLLPENAVSAVDYYMEEDRDSAGNSVEGEHQPLCDSEEKEGGNQPSDEAHISESVISVEGSEESEAIVPECRVNLSRIHLSPESTH